MSNELFIVCLSHDPEIRSDMVAWSASPAALATVRRWIGLRDLIASAQVAGLGIPAEVTHAAGAFLAAHPHCRLGLIDDSGTRHPATKEGDEEPAEPAEPEPPAPAAVSAEDAEREIAAAAVQIATAIRQASLFALDRPDPLPVVVCENMADAVIDLLRSSPELVTQITQGGDR